MDHGLLVIFLLASCWLYGAIILAIHDWRWNLGRVVQFTLCAALGAWFVLSGRTGPNAISGTVLLFAATVFLPFLVQRHMSSLLLQGRLRGGRF